MAIDAKAIATEILNQLGAGRFQAMVGAHNMAFGDDDGNPYLSLKFKGSKKSNYLKVSLMPSDTYKMEFGKIWGINYKVDQIVEDVYCDGLKGIFEQVTGLYTSL